jgi:hypothetical protein
MQLQRLQLKLYADVLASEFDLTRVVPLFHTFIRDGLIDDELLIDVADYSHVHQGPGIALIGHASDYYLDLGEGRPGLLYSRKREGPEQPEARLRDAFRRALSACRLLEADATLGLRFKTDEALLVVLDRLEAANDDASFGALGRVLEPTLRAVYGDIPHEIAREGSIKEPLTVRIRARGAPDVSALLARVKS